MNKLIIGNWKMYPTLSDAVVLATSLKSGIDDLAGVEVIIAPPMPWLVPVAEHWRHRPKHLHLAAQNVWPEDQGAYTGETSPYLLKDIISYALIGHSERRRYNAEDDDIIAQKIHACLKWRITPIVCVGEAKKAMMADGKVDNREWKKLADQLMAALEGLTADQLEKIVIAYEPVWAIGGTNPASPDYANKMIERLTDRVTEKYGRAAATNLRFLYGGSVTSTQATDYLRYPAISGLLVGSASVKAKEFLEICRQAAHLH